MKKPWLLLFCILLFAACRRDGLVEGYVFTEGYNEPMKGAKVVVSQSHHYNSDPPIASGTTDENGYFKIYYNHRKPGYQHYVSVSSDLVYGYFPKKRIEKKGKIDLFVTTGIPVKFRIKNNLPDAVSAYVNGMVAIRLEPQEEGSIESFKTRGFGETTFKLGYTNLRTNTVAATQTLSVVVSAKTDTAFKDVVIE